MALGSRLFFTFFLVLFTALVIHFHQSVIYLVGTLGVPVVILHLSWKASKFVRSLNASKVETEGKAIFITGCDSGFGFESALSLNRSGFRVFASCLFPQGEGAKELLKCAKYPDRMHIFKLDVTKDSDVDEAYNEMQSVLEASGDSLYGLLNNAGIISYGFVEFGDFEIQFKRMMDINFLGVVRVSRKLLPLIRKSKGRIATISSIAGHFVGQNITSYSASKFAARAFVEGLRTEVESFGVKVIDIEPSYASTSLIDFETIVNGFRKTVANSPQSVQNDYGPDYTKRCEDQLRFLDQCDAVWQKSTIRSRVVKVITEAFLTTDPFDKYLVLSPVCATAKLTMDLIPDDFSVYFIHSCERFLEFCWQVFQKPKQMK